MVSILNDFYYTIFGNSTISTIIAIATILLCVGVLVLLSWHIICRDHIKSISIFLTVTMCTVSVLALMCISPLAIIRYNGTYTDFKGEDISQTEFIANFGALKYRDSMLEGYQYTAYVGSSGATMVVIVYPDNCSVLYQSGSTNNIYVTSNDDTEFTYTTITISSTSVREVEQSANTVTRVTSVRDTNIVTTADIYDYAHPTEVIVNANY